MSAPVARIAPYTDRVTPRRRRAALAGAAALSIMCMCAGACSERGARRHAARAAPGDLPLDPEATLDDLYAGDLRVVEAREVSETVARLDLARGNRTFRAKWKPMGPGGSEVQDGYDGNNAPRCEAAAWLVNRMLFGETSEHHLVAPVAVRAFHRDVPCERACSGVPRLPGSDAPATFPELNDHLIVGALTWWIDGVVEVERFHGGFWSAERFASNPTYRRSFSDLCLFLALIGHGDANYSANFLSRTPALDRVYSIDNGRAFDGVPFYTGEGDPDWAPFAGLTPDALVAPAFSRETAERLEALDGSAWDRLRAVAAIDLASGEASRDPAARAGDVARLARRGRGVYAGRIDGRPWVLLGIGEQGIRELAARRAALVKRLRGGAELF